MVIALSNAFLCLQYPLSHMTSGQSLRIPLTDRKGNSAGEISFTLEVQGGRCCGAHAGLLLKALVPWGPSTASCPLPQVSCFRLLGAHMLPSSH